MHSKHDYANMWLRVNYVKFKCLCEDTFLSFRYPVTGTPAKQTLIILFTITYFSPSQ